MSERKKSKTQVKKDFSDNMKKASRMYKSGKAKTWQSAIKKAFK